MDSNAIDCNDVEIDAPTILVVGRESSVTTLFPSLSFLLKMTRESAPT